jgi:site-specific DNA-methyltransferase (adenine-specific)
VKPYYDDGQIALYCGDNRELLPQLATAAFDAVVTSPPYNLSDRTALSNGPQFREREHGGLWGRVALADGYGEGGDDAMPYPEYRDWQHGVLRECWRILSSRGAIYYNHKPRPNGREVRLPLDLNPGLPLRQVLIWRRPGGFNFNQSHYMPVHEWILVLAKPDFRLKNRGASGVGDVWEFPPDTKNPHPAPFPVFLPARVIETTGVTSVLDPHAGSGTVLRAAKTAGIRAVGIEKSPAYCEMAVRRLAQQALPLDVA